jgi:putative membrane protein
MKLSKSLMLGATLGIMLTANTLYAKSETTAKPTLTSQEIGTLATIATIDKGEILISIVALNKKDNSILTDFAKMMVDQHGANLTQILDMVDSAHAKSLSSSEAEKLAADGKKALLTVGELPGGDQFNKAYVDAMVSGHQAALNLIDHSLMKTAKSEDMKKFLTDTRATVADHLEHAKKLQEKMKA